MLGASWLPTAQLAITCLALAACGWVIGRFARPHPLIGAFAFAATLAVWNFGLAPAIDIPWLFRLLIDSFQNARYWESLFTSLAAHALLFASLFIGVRLSLQRERVGLQIE